MRWRCIVDKNVAAPYGLAVDEALVHSVAHINPRPVLHLYTFCPSVIVGRYQNLKQSVNVHRCHQLGITYNRRITGGGTVLMGPHQLALALVVSLDDLDLPRSISGIFRLFAAVFIKVLRRLGIQAEFRPKNDIQVAGKKIAGIAASVEDNDVLLFHSSLLADFDISLMLELLNLPSRKIADKGISCFSQRLTTIRKELGESVAIEALMDSIRESFEQKFGLEFLPGQLTSWEQQKTEKLIRERYSTPQWLFAVRSPQKKMGQASKKTPGGLLQVYLILSGNVIEDILVTGDFFSPSELVRKIESALKWKGAERDRVTDIVSRLIPREGISSLEVESLVTTIMEAKENCRLIEPTSGLNPVPSRNQERYRL